MLKIDSSKRRIVRQFKTMASQRKPVIVRKFSRDWTAGYAEANFGQNAAELEVLDSTGKVLRINWELVKWVCYVRDFPATGTDQANPERLLHKRFVIRPRTPGLWLRMTLSDGEELEGRWKDWRCGPETACPKRAARTVFSRCGASVIQPCFRSGTILLR
jgi:hypothetical protein